MKDRKQPDNPEEDATQMDTGSTIKKGGAGLGREIQAKIGQQLRAYYDTLIEPTPDRFADLLRQLDKPASSDSPKKPDGKEPTE